MLRCSPRLPRPVVDAPFPFHTDGKISINTLLWERWSSWWLWQPRVVAI